MKKTKTMSELVRDQSNIVKECDCLIYRDLNKNGVLDIYEDPRQPLEARVEDLLSPDDPGRKSRDAVHQWLGGQR